MSDKDHGDAALLGEPEEDGGHFLYLGHGPGHGIHILRIHGLDGIHDHKVRLHLPGLGDYGFNQGLTEYFAGGGVTTEAVGTHLHLPGTLLAGYIQCPQCRASKRNLEGKRGLAYSRLAADQDQRPFHDAPAQDPVNLSIVQRNPVLRTGVDLRQFLRRIPASGYRIRMHGLPAAGDHFMLHHRIPFTTCRTAPHPLGILIAAVRAEPDCLFLVCHTTNVRKKIAVSGDFLDTAKK